jgi:dipeptidyl aminopeptidase/acylaminoacyl peptidase
VTNKRFTPELLWKLPRVGSPLPDADGKRCVIPVTSYDIEKNEPTTRLWLSEDGRERAITGADSASQPAISADGKRVAFVRKPTADKDAKGQLWLLNLEGGEPEKLTDLPLGVNDPHWFADGKRVAFLSPLHDGHLTVAATAAEVTRRKDSKVKAHTTEVRIYRYWDRWISEEAFQHLFVLNVETRELKDLTPRLTRFFPLMELAGTWDIAPDGSEIAFIANRTDAPYHEMISGVYRLKLDGSEPRCVSEWTNSHAHRPRYSPDGKWLLFGAQDELSFYADRMRLVAFNRATGKHHVLTEPWETSPAEWEFANDKIVVFSAEDKGVCSLYSLDFERAVASPGEVEAKPLSRGGWYAGIKCAGGRVFTSRSGLRNPPEAVVLALQGKQESITSFCRPLIAEVELSEFEEHHVKGADGHNVQMVLVYPPGSARKHLPLVHLIHGGPHGAFGDQWFWRWSAQVFAAQGWLVAMVNFHGSTGWGNEFARCIMGEWGKKPYEDIEAATDYLIERGLADPDRMACAGGSYGGYMVAWIASQTNRYKCLVNHAGVSDLQAQYARDVTPGREKALGGEPWGDQAGMDRYNPIRHSKGFKTPMLIIHGEQDYRVPYTQALETYNAYLAQKQTARLVVYPDENHWILKPQNSLHWYGEVFGWLKRWL